MNEKECISCHIIKPLTEFHFRKDNQKYRNNCKDCRKKQHQDWAIKNKDKDKERNHNWYIQAKSKGLIKKYTDAIKQKKIFYINLLGGRCSNPNCACQGGYNRNISALEFHHIDPNDKENKKEGQRFWLNKNFMELIKSGKIKLLCSNCHKEEHWKEGNNIG